MPQKPMHGRFPRATHAAGTRTRPAPCLAGKVAGNHATSSAVLLRKSFCAARQNHRRRPQAGRDCLCNAAMASFPRLFGFLTAQALRSKARKVCARLQHGRSKKTAQGYWNAEKVLFLSIDFSSMLFVSLSRTRCWTMAFDHMPGVEVLTGSKLLNAIEEARALPRRDCFGILRRYLSHPAGKVMLLSGLRRTGKTVMASRPAPSRRKRSWNGPLCSTSRREEPSPPTLSTRLSTSSTTMDTAASSSTRAPR